MTYISYEEFLENIGDISKYITYEDAKTRTEREQNEYGKISSETLIDTDSNQPIVKRVITYNKDGEISGAIDSIPDEYNKDGTVKSEHKYYYDEFGYDALTQMYDYTYDKNGNLIKEEIKEVSDLEPSGGTIVEYNEKGNITLTINEAYRDGWNNQITVHRYDENGNLESIANKDPKIDEETNEPYTIINYREFDKNGNQTSRSQLRSIDFDGNQYIQVDEYDKNDHLRKESTTNREINPFSSISYRSESVIAYREDGTREKASLSQYNYDSHDDKLIPISEEVKEYNSDGKLSEKTKKDYSFSGSLKSETVSHYDKDEKPIREERYLFDGAGNPVLSSETQFKWSEGHLICSEKLDHNIEDFRPDGKTITYTEYERGNKKKEVITDYSPSFEKQRVTTNDYIKGRRTFSTIDVFGNGADKPPTEHSVYLLGRHGGQELVEYQAEGSDKSFTLNDFYKERAAVVIRHEQAIRESYLKKYGFDSHACDISVDKMKEDMFKDYPGLQEYMENQIDHEEEEQGLPVMDKERNEEMSVGTEEISELSADDDLER